jgi:hypothetical protein
MTPSAGHAVDVKAATLALVAASESVGEAARPTGAGKSIAKRWRDEALEWLADRLLCALHNAREDMPQAGALRRGSPVSCVQVN